MQKVAVALDSRSPVSFPEQIYCLSVFKSAAAGTSAAAGGNSAKMVSLSLQMIKFLPQEVRLVSSRFSTV